MKVYVNFGLGRLNRSGTTVFTEEGMKKWIAGKRAADCSIYVADITHNFSGLRRVTTKELVALGASPGTWRSYYKANVKANGIFVAGWVWPRFPNYVRSEVHA